MIDCRKKFQIAIDDHIRILIGDVSAIPVLNIMPVVAGASIPVSCEAKGGYIAVCCIVYQTTILITIPGRRRLADG